MTHKAKSPYSKHDGEETACMTVRIPKKFLNIIDERVANGDPKWDSRGTVTAGLLKQALEPKAMVSDLPNRYRAEKHAVDTGQDVDTVIDAAICEYLERRGG